MDENLPQFRAEVVCAVTGWNGGLLRTFRTRHGLFPATKQNGDTARWTRVSFVDLCQARTVAKLDNLGFAADDAVGISNHIRLAYEFRAKGINFASIAIVRSGLRNTGIPQTIRWSEPEDRLSSLYSDNSDLEAAIIIDCAEIYRTVRRILVSGGFYQDIA